MKSFLFRLNGNDIARGLVVAVLGAILAVLQEMLGEHGLDFGAYDWGYIFNFTWSAGVAYLAKNFLSDDDGKVLGSI